MLVAEAKACQMRLFKKNQNSRQILSPLFPSRSGQKGGVFVIFVISAIIFVALADKSFTFDDFEYSKKTVGQIVAQTEEIKVKHLKTPEAVKGIYMTSWVAGTKNWRDELIKFIDSTELNAVIIDVKDYSGRVCF